MPVSRAFSALDPRIQRYLWAEGWGALREVQELAIPPVLAGNRDVLIAASTASGKTEAAFLPALTYMLQQRAPGLIVYISPLKALINDQFSRLDRLCEALEIPVWRWHGDVTAASKHKFLQSRSGVLLITPESLEATLCTRGTSAAALFQHTLSFIVDELHAFIGTERGKQLQSLLHRIDNVLGRTVPRVALSATLGDMDLAADFLRRHGQVVQVHAPSGGGKLLVVIKGYEEPLVRPDAARASEDRVPTAPVSIAKYLFQVLHGSNNLVFPNSRAEVERYTHLLNGFCERARLPKEFWPHHGNLSKEIREETEEALKQRERPATAVCTSTLELGIDIGAVKCTAQIGTPPSVASLRQRLGRSGRRAGEPAILRGCVTERQLDGRSGLADRLRLDTVQTTAAVSLLLEHWFEPPAAAGAHYSTLVQQLLSVIAQYGGVTASQAFHLLCGAAGPFQGMSTGDFAELLHELGRRDVLVQDHSGVLLHGSVGDRIVNHYGFYAAFASDDEFRVVAAGRTLGTLPVTQLLRPGQRILFAGRTWLLKAIDEERRVIEVLPSSGGAAPLFNGNGGRIRTRVCQCMLDLYRASGRVPFLDATAQRFLDEGRASFQALDLEHRVLLDHGKQALLLTWLGDSANEAIACLLVARGIDAAPVRLGLEINCCGMDLDTIRAALVSAGTSPSPPVDDLLAKASNLVRQKWDPLLSPHLLRVSYASSNLDVDKALTWLKTMAEHNAFDPAHQAAPLPIHQT